MVSEKNLIFSKEFLEARKNAVLHAYFYYTIFFRANSIIILSLYVTKLSYWLPVKGPARGNFRYLALKLQKRFDICSKMLYNYSV